LRGTWRVVEIIRTRNPPHPSSRRENPHGKTIFSYRNSAHFYRSVLHGWIFSTYFSFVLCFVFIFLPENRIGSK
jgi:hypothetical protein